MFRMGCARVFAMSKLGIYVQVPFCQTKCTYCNFHTGVVAASRFGPYAAAVCREIREHRALLTAAGVDGPGLGLRGRSSAAPLQRAEEAAASEVGKGRVGDGLYAQELVVDTVYIGGGTPSLLDPRQLHDILDTVRGTFDAELVEVTLEADPETVEAEKEYTLALSDYLVENEEARAALGLEGVAFADGGILHRDMLINWVKRQGVLR